MHEYEPRGVCSTKISFDLVDGKVRNLAFEKGRNGNLKAMARLVEGMDADSVIEKLSGLDCKGRGTSCADQFARALAEAEKQAAKA